MLKDMDIIMEILSINYKMHDAIFFSYLTNSI